MTEVEATRDALSRRDFLVRAGQLSLLLTRPLGVSYESSPATAADNVRALNNVATIVSNWSALTV